MWIPELVYLRWGRMLHVGHGLEHVSCYPTSMNWYSSLNQLPKENLPMLSAPAWSLFWSITTTEWRKYCHVYLILGNIQLRWAALGIRSLGVHSQELTQSLLGPNSISKQLLFFFLLFFSIKDKICQERYDFLPKPQTKNPFVIIGLGVTAAEFTEYTD